jgi:hypothetical protein
MSDDLQLPTWTGEERPPWMTVICIIGVAFNLAFLFAVLTFSKETKAQALQMNVMIDWPHALNALIVIIAYIGLWRMRFWGYLLYWCAALGVNVYDYYHSGIAIVGIVLAAVVILIATANIRHMKFSW